MTKKKDKTVAYRDRVIADGGRRGNYLWDAITCEAIDRLKTKRPDLSETEIIGALIRQKAARIR